MDKLVIYASLINMMLRPEIGLVSLNYHKILEKGETAILALSKNLNTCIPVPVAG